MVQVSENYDYSLNESLEYFDYDTDCQGFSYPRISSLSSIQLAQVPAPPLPLLLTPLKELAEVAAAVSPVEVLKTPPGHQSWSGPCPLR